MNLRELVVKKLWDVVSNENSEAELRTVYDDIRGMSDDNLELFLKSFPERKHYIVIAKYTSHCYSELNYEFQNVYLCPDNGDVRKVLIEAARWSLQNLIGMGSNSEVDTETITKIQNEISSIDFIDGKIVMLDREIYVDFDEQTTLVWNCKDTKGIYDYSGTITLISDR